MENIPRMLLLAEHLKSKELNEAYAENRLAYSTNKINLMIGNNGICHFLFPFVVQELPVLFSGWKLTGNGYITYLVDPSLSNNYAILEFFGLSLNVLLHLFSIENQVPEKYGGYLLDRSSKPKHVAENIFRYLEILPHYDDELRMHFTRRVLIEKVQIKTVIINKRKKRR